MALQGEQRPTSPTRLPKRHPARRGYHLDMTPMVDVAFLLLTFFMLATTFTPFYSMELSQPQKQRRLAVQAEEVLTMQVSNNGIVHYRLGSSALSSMPLYQETATTQEPSATPTLNPALHHLLRTLKAEQPNITVVLSMNNQARYRDLVAVVDLLNSLQITRFSLGEIDGEKEQKAGVK